MTPPEDTLRPRLEGALGNVEGLSAAFLFGSQLTGKTWGESDLDLAVRWARNLDDEQRSRATLLLIEELTQHLGPIGERADIVDLDRASSAVAFKAVRDGVCVFARDDAERVRSIVDVARRYDDEAPMRERFRSAARRAARRMQEGFHG